LKIGSHLPKSLSNIKWLTFFGTRCIRFILYGEIELYLVQSQIAGEASVFGGVFVLCLLASLQENDESYHHDSGSGLMRYF